MNKAALGILLLFFLVHGPRVSCQSESSVERLRESFAHPPDDCRIMMRWWWFGPAVTKPEIRKELEEMKAAGIGGVEIATLYPLALDDSQTSFRNLMYLSNEHIDALRYAAGEARRLGMRIDVTLTSGWPFGGPHIPVTQAAGQLRVQVMVIPAGESSIAVPALSAGERLLAMFAIPDSSAGLSYLDTKQVMLTAVEDGRVAVPTSTQRSSSVVFLIASRTGMTVKRPAVGAEGFVLDHYDRSAIESHLHAVGDRLMEAFGENPPYAVFSDSLEDDGSDWTGNFLEEFHHRRGYDLTPHLPALIGDAGADTAAIRHDWGRTLTELANENYLAPLHKWAEEHHTLFRSQTYGMPPVTLWSNQYADLPEGEGKATSLMWRQFSDTRWAASAGHLLGKAVISSETWTWLHSPAFRATPLDMKAEADLHFLQGINQLVGHGWPYSPEVAGEPGWRMYAAGAFNTHNPWWFAMPELTGYLQRVSFALRQGKPANDVALLLPNDDAWARFKAGDHSSMAMDPSIDDSMPGLLGDHIISETLDAGFNLDFIDADAMDSIGIPYRVLIMPGVERIPAATYRKIEQYAKHGGIVVATRRLPSTAPGLVNAAKDTREIQEISQRMFREAKAIGHFVEDERKLGSALSRYLGPDVRFAENSAEIGFIHRHLETGELYFIVNTSNRPLKTTARFRQSFAAAEWWDAFTGGISPVNSPSDIAVSLEPYESRLIFFSSSAAKAKDDRPSRSASRSIDLRSDWTVSFGGPNRTVSMEHLHSWSDDKPFKYYSGRATFEKTIDLTPYDAKQGSMVLDFGEGTPVPKPDPLPEFNMRAYLDSPVREAAEVYVNGQRAGVVWRPPYRIDLSSWVKAGKNELRIVVGNTAINSLAGQALPDYRLLNDRFGERFTPQGMDHLEALPSGIVGGLWLREIPRNK